MRARKCIAQSKVDQMLAFYSPIFRSLQQKEISGLMTVIWNEDPFHSKWSLLAKSYSIIRDSVGKGNAPLDGFLAVSTKFLDIIEPHEYLETLGWSIYLDDLTEQVTLVRKDGRGIDSSLLSTTASVEDIVKYCYASGYITTAAGESICESRNSPVMAMAMAASAQSPGSKTSENSKANNDAVDSQADRSGAVTSIGHSNSFDSFDPFDLSLALYEFPMAPIGDTTSNSNHVTGIDPNVLPSAATNSGGLTAANITGTTVNHATSSSGLTSTLADDEIIGGYNARHLRDYDPDANVVAWAPHEGYAFDAFDISEWIHENAMG